MALVSSKKKKKEKKKEKQALTVKKKEYGILETLREEFMKDLNRICRHLFNVKHQYKSLKNLRENLKDDRVIIHIEFSENYNFKYHGEIQSMHYSASQSQLSIHTGVAYLQSKTIL